jgi:hypothetical protein
MSESRPDTRPNFRSRGRGAERGIGWEDQSAKQLALAITPRSPRQPLSQLLRNYCAASQSRRPISAQQWGLGAVPDLHEPPEAWEIQRDCGKLREKVRRGQTAGKKRQREGRGSTVKAEQSDWCQYQV